MTSRFLAVAVLSLALRITASHADPALDRGIQLFEQRKDAEASTALLPLASARPGNVVAAYYLGRITMRGEDPREAATWFEKAVRGEPSNANYHLWLGRAYGTQAQTAGKLSQLGLAKKTKTEFERAVALDPNLVDARLALVDYYLMAPGIAGGSVPKAKEQALEIKKRDPFRGAMTDARIAEDQKDIAGAERAYQAMLQAHPDSINVRYALGNLYTRAERYEDAFAAFEGILKVKPSEANALYSVGRTGALSGKRLDRAEAALKEFLALPVRDDIPRPAGAHWRLGMVYEKSGKKDLARTEYQRSLALEPKFEEARKSLAKLK